MEKILNGIHTRKNLFFQRLLLIFSFSLVFSFSSYAGVAASTNYSVRLTIKLENASLSDLIQVIKHQTKYDFSYDVRLETSKIRNIYVNVKDANIEKVMSEALRGTSITYKIFDKVILLSETQKIVSERYKADQKGVTGKVVDEEGHPLAGVSILAKGTTNGTVSDINGHFSLSLSSDVKQLVFSFIGLKTQNVDISGKNSFDVVMSSEIHGLQEVVAIGYGSQRKVNLTGAVGSIKSDELVATKNESLVNTLTGKIPGLRIVQNSSEPGSFNDNYDIRGMGSPLIVIDGIPRSNMDRLDPNDVESVSVLKDASAAIYGVRAANGVILITTKRGEKGTLKLSYSGNEGWQNWSGLPKSVDAIDYMTLYNESTMHNVNGGHITFTDQDFAPYRNGTKKSTDWYSPVIKSSAPQSEHNISATGGNDNTNYFFSVGYSTQDGFLQTGDLYYKKYNVRSNISTKITQNLSVDLNIDAIMDEKHQPYQSAWWIIRSFWRQVPTQSIYANDNKDYLINTQVDGTNPVAMSNQDIAGYQDYNNKWFQSSIAMNYKFPFVEGLTAKGMFSYDYSMSDNKMYQKQYNQYNYNGANDTYNAVIQQSPSNVTRQFYSNPTYLSQVSLNYNHLFNGVHNVGALLLYEASVVSGDNFYASRDLSLPVDQLLSGNSLNQQGYMDGNGLYKRSNEGLVGRLNYDYKSKYLAEFSFRDDGSSKFEKTRQWGFFPSASVGWRMSEENFWKNSTALSFIDNLKFRASYGKMGDDAASSYQFVTGYLYPANGSNNNLPAGSVFGGTFVNSLQSMGLANPDITWFVSKTFNLGVDVDAWHGLLGATFDVFRRNRTGLLATEILSLPSVVGASLPQENLNGDRTQGIELELTHKNSIGEFRYSVKGNIAFTRTENRAVVQAKAGNSYENWHNNSNNRWNDVWWGYGAAGQYQSYKAIVNSPVFVGRGTLPGDYAYQDWNGDGQISDLDVHPVAHNGMPLINYGLTVAAEYKGFDLNMLFQGTGMANVSYFEQLINPLWGGGSALTQFMDRWHPTDPTADPYNPNTTWTSGHYAYTGSSPDVNSTYNIQNASYIRLKSVELGYTIPKSAASVIGIKGARIYVNGYNLLTKTKVKYLDPEHPSSTYGYLYPLNKTYSVGLNVNF